MPVDVVYMRKDMARAWHSLVSSVIAEGSFLTQGSLPPFDPERALPITLIDNNWPNYVAIDGGLLVGWADIVPSNVPECAHRGTLGMCISSTYRGRGLGTRLLQACLDHAPLNEIDKVELTVFTTNTGAIQLYRKFGFAEYGRQNDFRRFDGVVYDALMMEKTLA